MEEPYYLGALRDLQWTLATACECKWDLSWSRGLLVSWQETINVAEITPDVHAGYLLGGGLAS